MRRFFVEIDARAFDALQTLAVRERRDVRDQAALLLERAVREHTGRRPPRDEAPAFERQCEAVPA